MNERTTNVLTLLGYYHVGSHLLADALRAKAEGNLLASHDGTTLALVDKANRTSTFWTVADVEKTLRGQWFSQRWGEHARLLIPGNAATEVDFKALATALLAGMVRLIIDNTPDAAVELPTSLEVDLHWKEKAEAAKCRQGKLDHFALFIEGRLFSDSKAIADVKNMGVGHPEDFQADVTDTDDRVAIRVAYCPMGRQKGVEETFCLDSDEMAKQFEAGWALRNTRQAPAWTSTEGVFTDLRNFEPGPDGFKAIACQYLRSVIRFANIK